MTTKILTLKERNEAIRSRLEKGKSLNQTGVSELESISIVARFEIAKVKQQRAEEERMLDLRRERSDFLMEQSHTVREKCKVKTKDEVENERVSKSVNIRQNTITKIVNAFGTGFVKRRIGAWEELFMQFAANAEQVAEMIRIAVEKSQAPSMVIFNQIIGPADRKKFENNCIKPEPFIIGDTHVYNAKLLGSHIFSYLKRAINDSKTDYYALSCGVYGDQTEKPPLDVFAIAVKTDELPSVYLVITVKPNTKDLDNPDLFIQRKIAIIDRHSDQNMLEKMFNIVPVPTVADAVVDPGTPIDELDLSNTENPTKAVNDSSVKVSFDNWFGMNETHSKSREHSRKVASELDEPAQLRTLTHSRSNKEKPPVGQRAIHIDNMNNHNTVSSIIIGGTYDEERDKDNQSKDTELGDHVPEMSNYSQTLSSVDEMLGMSRSSINLIASGTSEKRSSRANLLVKLKRDQQSVYRMVTTSNSTDDEQEIATRRIENVDDLDDCHGFDPHDDGDQKTVDEPIFHPLSIQAIQRKNADANYPKKLHQLDDDIQDNDHDQDDLGDMVEEVQRFLSTVGINCYIFLPIKKDKVRGIPSILRQDYGSDHFIIEVIRSSNHNRRKIKVLSFSISKDILQVEAGKGSFLKIPKRVPDSIVLSLKLKDKPDVCLGFDGIFSRNALLNTLPSIFNCIRQRFGNIESDGEETEESKDEPSAPPMTDEELSEAIHKRMSSDLKITSAFWIQYKTHGQMIYHTRLLLSTNQNQFKIFVPPNAFIQPSLFNSITKAFHNQSDGGSSGVVTPYALFPPLPTSTVTPVTTHPMMPEPICVRQFSNLNLDVDMTRDEVPTETDQMVDQPRVTLINSVMNWEDYRKQLIETLETKFSSTEQKAVWDDGFLKDQGFILDTTISFYDIQHVVHVSGGKLSAFHIPLGTGNCISYITTHTTTHKIKVDSLEIREMITQLIENKKFIAHRPTQYQVR